MNHLGAAQQMLTFLIYRLCTTLRIYLTLKKKMKKKLTKRHDFLTKANMQNVKALLNSVGE